MLGAMWRQMASMWRLRSHVKSRAVSRSLQGASGQPVKGGEVPWEVEADPGEEDNRRRARISDAWLTPRGRRILVWRGNVAISVPYPGLHSLLQHCFCEDRWTCQRGPSRSGRTHDLKLNPRIGPCCTKHDTVMRSCVIVWYCDPVCRCMLVMISCSAHMGDE